jgi:hypothetical protein
MRRYGSAFPQHPDQHSPEHPVLLAVDQELGVHEELAPSADGWVQPGNLSWAELDATLSAEDTETLQALMSVGFSEDRLEFFA